MIDTLRAGFAAGRAPGGLLCPASPVPMTIRRELGGVACVIVLTTLLFLGSFYDALFTGNIEALMAKGDSHLLNWSKAYFLDARLREGEFPLWDPMLLSGTAYVAHPLSIAFYPPNLIRALVVRAGTAEVFAYSMYGLMLFQFLVGSVGMYFWTRCAGISVASSVIVALAVCLCERWVFNSIAQTPIICAGAWAPVVLVALRQAVHSGGWRRAVGWSLLAGIAYGLQILAGWPQLAIYCTIAYVAYVGLSIAGRLELWRRPPSRAVIRGAGAAVLICATFGITGALIGSALMLPAKQLIDESARSRHHIGDYVVKTMVNAPPPLFFVIHFPRADPWTVDRGRALMAGVQASVSLISALFAVAFVSLLFLTHYRVFIHFALMFLLLDLTYGPPMPLSRLANEFAPFALSTPWYQAMLVSIPFGVLAGFALDKLMAIGRERRLPLVYAAILAVVGGVVVFLGRDPLLPDAKWSFANALLPAAVLLLLIFGRAVRYWPLLVAIALVAEIAYGARVQAVYATVGKGIFMVPLPPFRGDLRAEPDHEMRRARIICQSCNDHVWSLERAVNGYDPLVLDKTAKALSAPGQELIYLRRGSADGNLRALTLLRRSFWLAPHFVRGAMPEVDPAFPPTAVVYFEPDNPAGLLELSAGEAPRGTVAASSDERELWDSADRLRDTMVNLNRFAIPPRNSALRITYSATHDADLVVDMNGTRPFQYFGTGPLRIRAAESGVVEVPLPAFESGTAAIRLDSADPEQVAGVRHVSLVEDLADEIDRIEVQESKANSVRVRLRDLPAARALVFTETHYPGWVATVDGQPAPLVEANGAYQAVIVPPGTHEVEFAFRPRVVYAGVAVSVATLLLSIAASVFLLLPRRTRAST